MNYVSAAICRGVTSHSSFRIFLIATRAGIGIFSYRCRCGFSRDSVLKSVLAPKRKILARDSKPPRAHICAKLPAAPVGRISALATVLRHFSDLWRCVQRESARPSFEEMFALGTNRIMPERNSSRMALFIDGANIYATAKALGFDIDYDSAFSKNSKLRNAASGRHQRSAIVEDQEYLSICPLIDWLDYNSYTVVTKATKEFTDASGRRKARVNIDIWTPCPTSWRRPAVRGKVVDLIAVLIDVRDEALPI